MINHIFPKSANNDYTGSKLASVIFLLIALMGAVRSCIHFLAPDGGAGSIAGINLDISGSKEVIFAFSLWGSSQLLYAFIQLVIYFRYRTLIPFMYLLMLAETLMRMYIGHIKPINFSHTPPGKILNFVMIPLALVMFYLSVKSNQKDTYK